MLDKCVFSRFGSSKTLQKSRYLLHLLAKCLKHVFFRDCPELENIGSYRICLKMPLFRDHTELENIGSYRNCLKMQLFRDRLEL